MSNIDTKAIANQKVEKALRLIEQAQLILSEACAELNPIIWGADQWKMVGDHMDATNLLWHRVNQTIPRSKIDLDSDAKRRLAEQSAITKNASGRGISRAEKHP